jgi:hypothetical protein
MTHIETNQEIRNQVITLLAIERYQNAERLAVSHPIEFKRPLHKEKPETQDTAK